MELRRNRNYIQSVTHTTRYLLPQGGTHATRYLLPQGRNTDTHIHKHINVRTKVISENQACGGHGPAQAWFKNIGSLWCLSLDEVTGNGDECQNSGEIFVVDFAHTSFLFLSMIFLLKITLM